MSRGIQIANDEHYSDGRKAVAESCCRLIARVEWFLPQLTSLVRCLKVSTDNSRQRAKLVIVALVRNPPQAEKQSTFESSGRLFTLLISFRMPERQAQSAGLFARLKSFRSFFGTTKIKFYFIFFSRLNLHATGRKFTCCAGTHPNDCDGGEFLWQRAKDG